jgi:hypothetical protein
MTRKRDRKPETHNTNDELVWLNNIGEHNPKTRERFSRAEMLSKYIKAAKQRVDWEDIHKQTALAHAKELLKQCV